MHINEFSLGLFLSFCLTIHKFHFLLIKVSSNTPKSTLLNDQTINILEFLFSHQSGFDGAVKLGTCSLEFFHYQSFPQPNEILSIFGAPGQSSPSHGHGHFHKQCH